MLLRRSLFTGLLSLIPALAQQYPFLLVPNSPKNVLHILQDHTSRLWISTEEDVFCFDGTRFFSLHPFGFPVVKAQSITEDSDGGIWIASNTGLYRFYSGRLTTFFQGLPVKTALSIAPGVLLASVGFDANSTVLQHYQLYRLRSDRGSWNPERLADWKAGAFLTLNRQHTVFYPCLDSWCELSASAIVGWHPGAPDGPIARPSAPDLFRVTRDRSGCLWFRTLETASYQCPGDAEPRRLSARVAGHDLDAQLIETEDGAMLLHSSNSLAWGRPGAFQVATTQNGLPPGYGAMVARDGSIWIAGDNGLYRFAYPFRFEYWTGRDGLGTAMGIMRAGERVYAATGQGIALLNPDRTRWLIWDQSREFGMFAALAPGPNGTVYAAPARGGVVQFRADGTVAAANPGRPGSAAKLARTSDGQVWLGGAGVYRVASDGHRLTLGEEDLPGDRILASDIEFEPHTRKLWACYAGGLILKEDHGWRRLTTKDGLLENTCESLAAHPNGDLWLSYWKTHAFALIRLLPSNQVKIRQYYPGGEVGDAEVNFLDVDTRGWLWRSSSDGVHIADAAQAEAGTWLVLAQSDGLPSGDNGGNQQAFFSDPDGSVWWGAYDTVTHFTPPPDFVHPQGAPPVFLSSFTSDTAPPRLAETGGQFPHGSKVTVHLASMQFDRRNSVRVRYRLLPEQRSWREGRNLDLVLGSPGWGTHTLEVQSRYNTGAWAPAFRQSVVVLRPVWLAWQALLGFAAIVFAGTVGGLRWKEKRHRRASRALPDLGGWRLAALSPEIHELSGTLLASRYKVGDLLARGGFATVLKGRDVADGDCPCAIKVFRGEFIDPQWLSRRFQQEVSALEQIHHPNVVGIRGHGTTSTGAPYLVMEFVEGITLRDLLLIGPIPPARTAVLLQQAAGALDQIHARGICHRDLKPENLMIRSAAPPGEDLVLIDFSIAIVQEPDATIHGLSRAAGTIYYMAPEQAVGYAIPASDVYSLAKIVIEMLTGQRISALLPDAALDLPQRVLELAARFPFPLSAESIRLLGAALEFDPTRRPQQAGEFAGLLVRDLLIPPSGPSTSPSPSPNDGAPAGS